MLLKMTTGLSGPTLCLGPGDEHDFDDEAEAARLVEAGYAVPVESEEQHAARKAAEKAAAEAAANAAAKKSAKKA